MPPSLARTGTSTVMIGNPSTLARVRSETWGRPVSSTRFNASRSARGGSGVPGGCLVLTSWRPSRSVSTIATAPINLAASDACCLKSERRLSCKAG
jgi:hypothetical protein